MVERIAEGKQASSSKFSNPSGKTQSPRVQSPQSSKDQTPTGSKHQTLKSMQSMTLNSKAMTLNSKSMTLNSTKKDVKAAKAPSLSASEEFKRSKSERLPSSHALPRFKIFGTERRSKTSRTSEEAGPPVQQSHRLNQALIDELMVSTAENEKEKEEKKKRSTLHLYMRVPPLFSAI